MPYVYKCCVILLYYLHWVKKTCSRDNDIWFVEWLEHNYLLNFIFIQLFSKELNTVVHFPHCIQIIYLLLVLFKLFIINMVFTCIFGVELIPYILLRFTCNFPMPKNKPLCILRFWTNIKSSWVDVLHIFHYVWS